MGDGPYLVAWAGELSAGSDWGWSCGYSPSQQLATPYSSPVPVYPEVGPQVIMADDDGMEVDGPTAAAPPLHKDVEDKEQELVSDEDGEAIFDADSDDEPRV